jgi:hypothetical protein
MREPQGRRRIAIGAVAVALLVVGVVSLATRDQGFDPLGRSSPAEAVRRTARLAGFEQVRAGENGENGAFASLAVPAVSSAADIEIAWQTGFASLAVSYPDAEEYLVLVLENERTLVQMRAGGAAVREAVSAGNPYALVQAMRIAYPPGAAGGWEPHGNIEVEEDLPGEYLDAKNRAAGLLDDDGPTGEMAEDLSDQVAATRAVVPGVPAPAPDSDAGRAWAALALEIVRTQTGIDGSARLAAELAAIEGETPPARVLELRALYMTVRAFEPPAPFGSVLAPTAAVCGDVLARPLAAGPASDAVLAAAASGDAPASAMRIVEFERVGSLDVAAPYAGDSLPARAHAAAGAAGLRGSSAGKQRVRPAVWEAYRRADGALFWLAPEDGVALTDASVRGWAFTLERAGLVEAQRCGVILDTFPVR